MVLKLTNFTLLLSVKYINLGMKISFFNFYFGHYTTVLPGPRSTPCPTVAVTLVGLEAINEDIP